MPLTRAVNYRFRASAPETAVHGHADEGCDNRVAPICDRRQNAMTIALSEMLSILVLSSLQE